jgi:hypothetical protein
LRFWHDVLAALAGQRKEGLWDLIHFALLNWLACDGAIDWSRADVDSCSVRAVHGGAEARPNPTDRAKRHTLADAAAVHVRPEGARTEFEGRGLAVKEGHWGSGLLVVEDLDGNQLFFNNPHEPKLPR